MIKILSKKPINKDEFFSTEPESRLHVTPNEPWVAFEIDKNTINEYLELILEVSYKGFGQSVRAYGFSIKDIYYIVAIQGMSYNDLYALYIDGDTEDSIVVPTTDVIGYIETTYRRKYISTTVQPYWTASMRPVILSK